MTRKLQPRDYLTYRASRSCFARHGKVPGVPVTRRGRNSRTDQFLAVLTNQVPGIAGTAPCNALYSMASILHVLP